MSALLTRYFKAYGAHFNRSSFVKPYSSCGKRGMLYSIWRKVVVKSKRSPSPMRARGTRKVMKIEGVWNILFFIFVLLYDKFHGCGTNFLCKKKNTLWYKQIC